MEEKTALIFTKTEQPYAFHNITYLALPNNTTYKFRYLKKHFGFTGQKNEDIKILNLKGIKGILVLDVREKDVFVSLRKFEIREIDIYGDFVFLSLYFLEYIQYGLFTDSTEAENELRKFDNILKVVTKNKAKDDLIFLVPTEAIQELDMQDSIDLESHYKRWSNLVLLLSSIQIFKGLPFFIIGRLSSTKETINPSKLSNNRFGYQLITGESYHLEIVQSNPNLQMNSEPFNLQVNYSPQLLSSLNKDLRTDGKYDRIDFDFEVLPQTESRKLSAISISCFQSSNGTKVDGIAPVKIPEIKIDVQVKWKCREILWKRVCPIIAFLSAIVFWIFGPKIVEFEIIKNIGLTAEYLRYIAIFLLAFSFQNWSSFIGQFKVVQSDSQK